MVFRLGSARCVCPRPPFRAGGRARRLAGLHGLARSAALSVLVAVLALSACGGGGDGRTASSPPGGAETRTPRRGGTLVVGLAAAPDALNIYMARSIEAAWIANRTLPRLACEMPADTRGEGAFRPDLATRWTSEEGGRAMSIDLAPGRSWSDGAPINCADLVYTFKAQTSPVVAWRGASLKRHIAAIECPSETKATVRFARVTPGQFMDVNDLNVLPRALEKIPFEQWKTTDWATALPAGGPFRIAKVTPGQEVVLERNPSFKAVAADGNEGALLDRIVFRVVPDATARVTGLLAGSLDLVDKLSPDDAARVRTDPGTRVETRDDWAYTYLGWVAKDAGGRAHPVFGDARVRRAMTLAIDRASLVDGLLRGEGEVPASPMLAPLPEHDPALAPWPVDREQAKALLRAAGFADRDGDGTLDRGGKPFVFRLAVQAGHPLRRAAAALIQQDLATIGVGVTIEPIENSSFYAAIARRDGDAWIGQWRTSRRVDMTEMLHASSCAAGANNFGCWSREDADALAAAARDEPDDARRADGWRRWERIFHEEQPYTMLFRPKLLVGVRRGVHGTGSITASDLLDGVEGWWVDGNGTVR